MAGLGQVVILVLGLTLLYFVQSSSAQYYQNTDLENFCNGNLTLECPYNNTGRAGTFRYYCISWLPRGVCYFNVTLAPNCGNDEDLFAFYFNIRKLNLPSRDYIKIYQTVGAGQWPLKDLNGSQPALSNPSSVAQASTLTYRRQPSIMFEYFRSSSPVSGAHDAIIDFVIYESNFYPHNTWCFAFQGNVTISTFVIRTDRRIASTVQRVLIPFLRMDSTRHKGGSVQILPSQRHPHGLGIQRIFNQL
ncbi:uncharacterized protein LOC129596530 [Paramacrobiotus metropolitanus]|uniref:uncharacterized protein LOC129596530 n=1 Tax=Paramacrobiotus metropolitanus TaxID=2943436 RepID=UPI0024464D65|nr:uncharacterized protein LOC129596530 [Paramacrobiotus metropolitanus]